VTKRVETWQLRAQFAAALSTMYGAEVPAYTTLVEVSAEVNRDPSKPVVYEDFLPASAAGIFRSNLDSDADIVAAPDDSDYTLDWMAGAIDHHIHDPYELYEKAAS
jgi:uncharacterized glyoxalase superfamily metalloenzyme YdcJ